VAAALQHGLQTADLLEDLQKFCLLQHAHSHLHVSLRSRAARHIRWQRPFIAAFQQQPSHKICTSRQQLLLQLRMAAASPAAAAAVAAAGVLAEQL
jgi:hypothetical protein